MSRLIKPSKKLLCFLVIFSFFSCSKGLKDKSNKIDFQADLTKKEFKNALIKGHKKSEKKDEKNAATPAPIPALSKLIISPPPPVIGGEKLVSFSVTDQVPLKDVLIELARVAKIDIDIDPKISGGIIINAKSRPLKEIIDRIATLGNLRYSYKNGVLYFESDTPFLKNYFVDYLVDGNLWKDVEANISSILGATASEKSSSLLSDESLALPSSAASSNASSFTSNKSAGIVALFATNKQHEAVAKYLADVEKSASAQVLIESKLVEVVLSEDFRFGIDWSKAGEGNSFSVGDGGALTTASTAGGSSLAMPFVVSASGLFNSKNIDVSVSALEAFGTTRALASPRIHAINNQKATLNFGDKLVYFKIDNNQNVTTTGTATANTSTISSTKQEESVGIKIEIVPSINLKTEEITLSIKPTISSSNRSVTDPASPVNATTGKVTTANDIPVIQTTELNTIAKIHSGNIVIIGGLMKEASANKDNGVPFLSKIPFMGWLFKSVSRSSQVTETVIFVKATIVGSSKPPAKRDREFQEKFDTTTQAFFE